MLKTYCTIQFLDSYNKPTTRRYQYRGANPSDADVEALATVLQAYTALSVVKATVSREVDVTAITTAAEAKSSRQKDASLIFQKSGLRQSSLGNFTLNTPEPKAALVDSIGKINLTDGAVTAIRELFDDGAGIAAIVGNWYVSDGEELIEDADLVDGYLNQK